MTSNAAIAKPELRRQLRILRAGQTHPDDASLQIQSQLTAMSVWKNSRTTLFYINVRDEVQTEAILKASLQQLTLSKSCVVPFCEGKTLALVRIRSWEELSPGAFGILEPQLEIRHERERRIDPKGIDLALIPGLGFDLQGGRLGYGRGFYDRLIPNLRPEVLRIALAFECQLVPSIPMDPHDQRMDVIVTERRVCEVSPARNLTPISPVKH